MIYFAVSIIALALMYGLTWILHLISRKKTRMFDRLGIGMAVAMIYNGCWFAVWELMKVIR